MSELSTTTSAQTAKLRGLTASFLVVLTFALGGCLVAVVYLAFQNFGVLQKVDSTNERLIDCTEPGGECYEASTKRTAEAVTGIIAGANQGTLDVIVAAISCQEDGITERKALARCTVNRTETVDR